MKPSQFTLCCRFFFLSLVELWEIIVIKSLLFYSEPLSPFISKNTSLHLPSSNAAGLRAFFLSSFLMSEGKNRHLSELVQSLVGVLLLHRTLLPLLHICCLSCINLMSKKISDPVFSPQSKCSHCIFEEVSVASRRDFEKAWVCLHPT